MPLRAFGGLVRALLGLQFAFILAAFAAKAACPDQSAPTNSVVSITRHFTEEERKSDPTLLGVRGTGWFLSSHLLVTAAHVAESMGLAAEDWKEAELGGISQEKHLQVRLRNIAGPGVEKIAILELKESFPGAEPISIRREPLVAGESVYSLGYPANHLRLASGRFVKGGDEARLDGTALFELFDGDDRLALDHGASGAPVLDCKGRVVAVVSNVFAKTLSFMSQAIRVSTAWGSPNVVALPVTLLEDDLPPAQ
ncbi:MAG: serine protease [Rhodomicrobium sp.]